MINKTAVFSCVHLTGYFFHCIRTFAETFHIHCHIVSYPIPGNYPFVHEDHPLIKLYTHSGKSTKNWWPILSQLNPVVSFIPGWIDQSYIALARVYLKKKIPVVMGLDNHWRNTYRQQLGQNFKARQIRKYASHIWIPGEAQYEFALRMGFKNNNILTGLYSGDINAFKDSYTPNITPHNILFVGRFVAYKRPVELIQSFDRARAKTNSDWTLTLIGRGEEQNKFQSIKQVEVIDFLQTKELVKIGQRASVLCLPSTLENWGVVVHEFAAAGKLLILSDGVGAARELLITGYNGFTFPFSNLNELELCFERLFQMSDTEIAGFQQRSFDMARYNSPEKWAYKLYAIANK